MKTTTKRKSRDTNRAKVSLCDVLSACEIYQSRSDEVTGRILALRERYNLTRLEWRYLDGYGDAIIDRWYRTKLAYCVEFKGELYKMNWSEVPEEVREHIRNESTLGKLPNGHFWLNKDGTIGKPYFISL